MRRLRWLAVVLVLVTGAAVLRWGLGEREGDRRAALSPGARLDATVVRVVDGDTIRASVGGRSERVRYIGIDTPETGGGGGPRECFAERATARNRELVNGERVVLRIDVEPRDRYGRLLAYVHRRRDDLFVNLELVRSGFATILTIPPNVAHAEDFLVAQTRAREAGAGLWRACR